MIPWPTAKELAGVVGMPGTERGVQLLAKRSGWGFRKRTGSKALEYNPKSLPKDTHSALLDAAIMALPAPVCALTEAPAKPAAPPAKKAVSALTARLNAGLPEPASLATWQRDTMDARLQILQMVDQLSSGLSTKKAIEKVVAMAQHQQLPEHIQALIPTANARSGADGKRLLSTRTLFRWLELRGLGYTALAPVETATRPVPTWATLFLKCWQQPQKPSVPMAIETMSTILPAGMALPSVGQARRFLNRMSRTEREKGRYSAKELRALLPYRQRDTSQLFPLDVVQCDGHSFKARVAHPVHGKPFHPEVCAVVDAATRLVLGWSAGLAESAETVADALRHAISIGEGKERGGIPAIFYTDPGSGNKAAVNADPSFGRYARLGITFKTGIVGNSQARGMVERMQQSLWIRAAKQLPTFDGKGMDSSVEHKTYRLLMADVRGDKTSKLMPSWPQFLDLCHQAVERYNNSPHSSLPKITDKNDRVRHMTPAEKWDEHIATGWAPATLHAHELTDLFRPRQQVKTLRGQVRLFGNVYFGSELKHHHGETVFVEYEPQNGQFVYVRDTDGHLLCRAEFDGNKSSMFPVSEVEHSREKRALGRLKRLEVQRTEIIEERTGLIEIAPPQQTIDIDSLPELPAPPVKKASGALDIGTPEAMYSHWKSLDRLLAEGETLSDTDLRFHAGFQNSAEYRSLKKMEADFGEDFFLTGTESK